ncbi:MAG: choline dehydrogenase [Rhodospirillaceae bacterium]|nr:MAG: choline dehydrogenase [Rhodospirillaceae bacterium]
MHVHSCCASQHTQINYRTSMTDFDFIIVGGGSAGCVLARRLSDDPKLKVCLIEAGAKARNPAIHLPFGLAVIGLFNNLQWGYETAPQQHLSKRHLFWPRGKVLGGSSAVNAMVYARGMRADYDNWAQLGAEGWDYDSILPYFRKAEANQRGGDHIHGADGPLSVSDLPNPNPLSQAFVDAGAQAQIPITDDFNRGEDCEAVGIYQVTTRNGLRASAARAYLSPDVRQRPNLTILTQTSVRRLEISDRRAWGVQITNNADEQQTLRASREVLLSAGAINSPHLLMLSGIGPAEHLRSHGIDVVKDAPFIGQRLADHLDVITQFTSRGGARGGLGFQWNLPPRGLRWAAQWLTRRGGTLASNLAEAGGFVKSDPQLDRPDIQFHFLPARMANHGRELVWGYGYTLHACNLYPRSEGEIRLTSADPKAPPMMDPRYLSDPDGRDMHVMMAALDWSRRILAAPAFDPIRGRELQPGPGVQTEDEIRAWIMETAETIYHPVGTVAMGAAEDPRASLTPDLRVKGIAALRVVDASVMPRLIGGNTNAPTIMIAEKAAEMILAAARTGTEASTP